MTEITFYRDNGIYTGFKAEGHASFARRNKDIVCAAISALTQTTVNSLDEINHEDIEVATDDGLLIFNLKSNKEPSSQILLQSLYLGLEGISKEYGTKYCKVVIKEEETYVKA